MTKFLRKQEYWSHQEVFQELCNILKVIVENKGLINDEKLKFFANQIDNIIIRNKYDILFQSDGENILNVAIRLEKEYDIVFIDKLVRYSKITVSQDSQEKFSLELKRAKDDWQDEIVIDNKRRKIDDHDLVVLENEDIGYLGDFTE